MLVADTSAVLEALAAHQSPAGIDRAPRRGRRPPRATPHRHRDAPCTPPHEHRTTRSATTVLKTPAATSPSLALVRYGHQPLSDRVWELRHNVTALRRYLHRARRGSRRSAHHLRRPSRIGPGPRRTDRAIQHLIHIAPSGHLGGGERQSPKWTHGRAESERANNSRA